MSKRWLIIGFAVAAVVLLGTFGRSWYTRVKTEKLALLEAELDKADPRERRHAAEVILELDPMHVGARLARVRATLALGEIDAARVMLADLLSDETFPNRKDLLLLQFDTILDEAGDMVAASTPNSSDITDGRVSPMLDDAESARRELYDLGLPAQESLILEARELDLRAELLYLRVRSAKLDLARSALAMLDTEAERLNRSLLELTKAVKTNDQRLAGICQSAMQTDANDPRPLGPVFHSQLRARKFTDARATAARMANFKTLTAELAADAADLLLNIEPLFGESEDEGDLPTVERLLTHPNVADTPDLRRRLTLASLRLRQQKYDEADNIAAEVLRSFEVHPRAMCIRARALTGKEKPDQAMSLLATLSERVRSADVLMAMAEASQAMRMDDRAIPYYRQAIQKDPDSLRARLALIDCIARVSGIIEAEPEIRVATKLSPSHPRVRAVRARLLVARGDVREIRAALRGAEGGRAWTPTWLDVAAAVALALDDQVMSSRIIGMASEGNNTPSDAVLIVREALKFSAAERLDQESRGRKEKIAEASRTDADRRADAAFALVRALDVMIPGDPMREAPPAPPEAIAWASRHAAAAATAAAPGAAPKPIDPRDVTDNLFLPDTLEIAARLLSSAAARWPDRPELRELRAHVELWLDHPDQAREAASGLSPDKALDSATLKAIATHLGPGGAEASSGDLLTSAAPTASLIALRTDIARRDQPGIVRDLKLILTAHPRAERACIQALRDAAAQDRPVMGDTMLAALEEVSPKISRLALARWLVATSRPGDAIAQSNVYLTGDDRDGEVRRRATEAAVRARLVMGASEQAAGLLETYAALVDEDRFTLRLAAVDVRLAANRIEMASSSMTQLLNTTSDLSPRDMDLMLGHASAFMEAPRFRGFLDAVLTVDPANPLARLYRADSLRAEKKFDEAIIVAKSVYDLNPKSSRAALIAARVAASAGKTDDARRLYAAAEKLGGGAGRAATVEAASPQSAPAGDNSTKSQGGGQ